MENKTFLSSALRKKEAEKRVLPKKVYLEWNERSVWKEQIILLCLVGRFTALSSSSSNVKRTTDKNH